MEKVDLVIVGGGIAGASLAAECAAHASVLLIEAEDSPGYHSTGRSAAFWSESYGGPLVQPLTTASGAWLRDPPADFRSSDGPDGFLSPRGALHLGRAVDAPAMAALQADFAQSGVAMHATDPAAIVPGLRAAWSLGLAEPSCADIDVAGLHAAYLRVARRRGATIRTGVAFESASRAGKGWQITTRAGPVAADILVDAAGAWADAVAVAAGVSPMGITPYRRTIAQLRIDPPATSRHAAGHRHIGQFLFQARSGRSPLAVAARRNRDRGRGCGARGDRCRPAP